MNANEILDEMEKIFPNAKCELYHESAFQELASQLPFQPGSVIQIPFFVYVSDTL